MYGDSTRDCIYAFRQQLQDINDVNLSTVESTFENQLKRITTSQAVEVLTNFKTINNRACSGTKSNINILGIHVSLARQVSSKEMTRNRLLALLHQKIFLSKEDACKQFRSEFIELLDETDLPYGCKEILPLVGGGFHLQYEFLKKRDMKPQFWLMCLALDYLSYVNKVRYGEEKIVPIRSFYSGPFQTMEGVFSSALRHTEKIFKFVTKKYINGRSFDKIRFCQPKLDKLKEKEQNANMDDYIKQRMKNERIAMQIMGEH